MYKSIHNICLIKWIDNNDVTLISTYLGPALVEKVKCYDCVSRMLIEFDRLAIVCVHNRYMGGIDLFYMMCTLYKRHIKRWYF